jgi:murein DD-endopeptidase MepM/ murein hydrolase activator NlpD
MLRFPFNSKTDLKVYKKNGRFLSQRKNGRHGALDFCYPHGTPIIAAESGMVSLHYIERFSDIERTKPDVGGHIWHLFCASPYGGVVILYGDSGLIHIICHSDLEQIMDMSKTLGLAIKKRKHRYQKEDITSYTTFPEMHRVEQGDQIGLVGNSGQSTEPHADYAIFEGGSPYRWGKRIDPEGFWDVKGYYV